MEGYGQSGYTVYAMLDGEVCDNQRYSTKAEAIREYRLWESRWPKAAGYEVCVYRGHDLAMIASNWPADEQMVAAAAAGGIG